MNSNTDVFTFFDNFPVKSACILNERFVVYISLKSIVCLDLNKASVVRRIFFEPQGTSSPSNNSLAAISMIPLTLQPLTEKNDVQILVQMKNGLVIVYSIYLQANQPQLKETIRYYTLCIGYAKLAPLQVPESKRVDSLFYIEENQQFLIELNPQTGQEKGKHSLDLCTEYMESVTHITYIFPFVLPSGKILITVCSEAGRILMLEMGENQIEQVRYEKLELPNQNQGIILDACLCKIMGSLKLMLIVRNLSNIFVIDVGTAKLNFQVPTGKLIPRLLCKYTDDLVYFVTTTHLAKAELKFQNEILGAKIEIVKQLNKQPVLPNSLSAFVSQNQSLLLVGNESNQLLIIQI